MRTRIGINGFGRIGRIAARLILNSSDLKLSAINSSADTTSHAYLLQYDSVYGKFGKNIASHESTLVVEDYKIVCFQEEEPALIPWQNANVRVVLECSGKFRTSKDSQDHLRGTVKHVIISSPVKDATPTYVLGVNHKKFNPLTDSIISSSSCTTNCVAVVVKVLDDAFGVIRGNMVTIHAATDSQNLLDNSQKKDVRLRRSALVNLIPTSSGSAKDIVKLFPHLNDKLPCRAIRVPTPTVSLIDLVVEVAKPTNSDKVNAAFLASSQNELKGIISVATEELVSTDYIGSPYSAVVDPYLTDVVERSLVHIVAWYDNEWGYTKRLVDLMRFVAGKKSL